MLSPTPADFYFLNKKTPSIPKNDEKAHKKIEEADLTKKQQNKYLDFDAKNSISGASSLKSRIKDKVNFSIIDKHITCIEYAPDVFAHLRDIDGFSQDDLKESLDPENEQNIKNIFKAGEGMGKSGSFFFFSHDDRFLIKTMTTDDFNAFMRIFKFYFEHVNVYKKSLIARVYGVY